MILQVRFCVVVEIPFQKCICQHPVIWLFKVICPRPSSSLEFLIGSVVISPFFYVYPKQIENGSLGGGFKDFLFFSVFGEMIQLD